VRVDEPGADLAVALALASAARGAPLAEGGRPIAAFGELGLTGELRHVPHGERRLAEARKFGLPRVMSPGEGKMSLRGALREALAGAAEAAQAA
jgi:DNA repair protein RadA/Sms